MLIIIWRAMSHFAFETKHVRIVQTQPTLLTARTTKYIYIFVLHTKMLSWCISAILGMPRDQLSLMLNRRWKVLARAKCWLSSAPELHTRRNYYSTTALPHYSTTLVHRGVATGGMPLLVHYMSSSLPREKASNENKCGKIRTSRNETSPSSTSVIAH